MIKVLLADDHAIVRHVLLLLLERAGGMQVVALASNGQEAVAQAVLYSPNVAVMDGIEATRQSCAHCPRTHVLRISMHQTSEHVRRGIQAGALGYVLKDVAGAIFPNRSSVESTGNSAGLPGEKGTMEWIESTAVPPRHQVRVLSVGEACLERGGALQIEY